MEVAVQQDHCRRIARRHRPGEGVLPRPDFAKIIGVMKLPGKARRHPIHQGQRVKELVQVREVDLRDDRRPGRRQEYSRDPEDQPICPLARRMIPRVSGARPAPH
jgi:hypothetical protein